MYRVMGLIAGQNYNLNGYMLATTQAVTLAHVA